MPAKSTKQRRAAGMALAIKRGKTSHSRTRGAVKSMMKMKDSDLRDFARKQVWKKSYRR